MLDRRGFLQLSAVTVLASGCAVQVRGLASSLGLPPERVVEPGSARYDEARGSYNARVPRRPRAIVYVRSAEEVATVVRWARARGVELRVRSGGHSYEGYSSVDDGLVVDVGLMASTSFDESSREVDVGPGCTLLPLHEALAPYGATLPGGSCASVGIAGLALGGGIGLLSRRFGLTCDRLVAADVVTADGSLFETNERDHADLFWALRGGGGGNFGIVTRLRFRACEVRDPVTCFAVDWSHVTPEQRRSIVLAWQDWAPVVDDRLTSTLLLGGDWIHANGLFLGAAEELPSLLASFDVRPRGVLHSESLPYIVAARRLADIDESVPYVAPARRPQRAFKCSSALAYENLPGEAVDVLSSALKGDSVPRFVHLDAYGGKIAEVQPTATAFVHRQARFSLQYETEIDPVQGTAAGTSWVSGLRRALSPYTRGAYVNYLDADIEDWANEYYGLNLARLRRVKTRYDPGDFFRFPQSIPRVNALG